MPNAAVLAENPSELGPRFSEPYAGEIRLLYTTRDYPHKNLDFLPSVRLHAESLGLDLKFVVTLTNDEWVTKSSDFHASCVNVGPVRVGEIADLHAQVFGVFFPSLLEASSATPMEAMALGSPLFASDLSLIHI